MHHKPVIWILLFLLAFSRCVHAASDFEFGPRPSNSVFDPTGVLSKAVTDEISATLTSVLKQEGVDIIVVVLPDLGQAPPEHVADRFGAAWCSADAHCVVLHSPERDGSPWIVPGKKWLAGQEPQQTAKIIEAARRRAAAEAKDSDKVKAAAGEAADMLRFRHADEINRSQARLTESTRLRLELETKSRQARIFILGGVAIFLLSLVAISFLISRLRKIGPARFPNHAWQLRLGAPHAGGNHAVVEMGKPSPPRT